MSGIEELMTRFAAIPGSEIGCGPHHPTDPQPELEARVSLFLETYPVLRDDAGYVEFLEKYAGASIENEDFSQIVDILGFTESSTDIEEMDGPIVDRNGFLMVAEAVYHLRDGDRNINTIQHAFAYDVTGGRPQGLYQSTMSAESDQAHFVRSFENFEAWLEDIIAREGWLDPPRSP